MKQTTAYKLLDSAELNVTKKQKIALLKIKRIIKKLNEYDPKKEEPHYQLYMLALGELIEEAGYDIAYAGPRNAIPNDVDDCQIIIDPYRDDDQCFLQKTKN